MDELSGENEEISCGDSIFSLLLSVTEEVSDEEAFGEQTAEELAEPLFDLRINRPTAWIEFLKSNEKAIVLKALDNLYKASRNYPDLRKRLIERGVVAIIVNKLVYAKEAIIKAHSLRLLAELLKYNTFCVALKKLKKLSLHLIKVYKKSSLIVLQEFSSLVLALICHNRELRRFMVMTSSNDFNCFLLRLSSRDPDVQYNSLQLIYKMIQDKYCGQFIVNLQSFLFRRFFKLLKSEYLEIQATAVNILTYLIKRNIKELHELFLEEHGLYHMMNFLQEYTWREHHPKIFTILRIVVKFNQEETEFEKQWIDQLVDYIDLIGDDHDLIYQDLSLILQMTENPVNNRELSFSLIRNKAVALLLLMDSNDDLKLLSIRILIKIPIMEEGKQKRICSDEVMKELIHIVNLNGCEGKLARYAVLYIHNLIRFDEDLMKSIVNENTYLDQFMEWLSTGTRLPNQFAYLLLRIFNAISFPRTTRRVLITKEMFTYLFTFMKINAHVEKILNVRISAANIFYNLLENDGHKIYEQVVKSVCNAAALLELLKTVRDNKLIEWIFKSIKAIIQKSESLTIHFIEEGCLKWITTNQKLWSDCQQMVDLINTFFRNFLPIKFEYMGFLDFRDFTKSGFYVQRCQVANSLDFPMLTDMMKYEPDSSVVFYVVCYDKVLEPETFINLEESAENHEICTVPLGDIAKFVKKEERICDPFIDTGSLVMGDQTEHITRQIKDPRMTDYIKILKENVKPYKRTGVLDRVWINETVKLITSVVIEALGGGSECRREDDYHHLFLHINEIKLRRKSCIIPMGEMSVGQKFERAILFKCLADVIGIPNRLVRGHFGTAWNEVCLMKWDRPYCDLPLSRLLPTHVVDLWHKPGRLLPIGRRECEEYCGPKAAAPFSMRPSFPDLVNAKENTQNK